MRPIRPCDWLGMTYETKRPKRCCVWMCLVYADERSLDEYMQRRKGYASPISGDMHSFLQFLPAVFHTHSFKTNWAILDSMCSFFFQKVCKSFRCTCPQMVRQMSFMFPNICGHMDSRSKRVDLTVKGASMGNVLFRAEYEMTAKFLVCLEIRFPEL